MDEIELQAGPHRPVVRIGDTVRRRPEWWTPAVHELLAYLNSTGFPLAPEVRGFDEEGREVLSYIEGDSGRETLRRLASDDGLAAAAGVLRRYHDAVASFRPSATAEWAYGRMPMTASDIVCHGDFGAWNLVWRGDEPVGILDWDLAYPGPALDDVAYALAYGVPFRDDDAIDLFAFDRPPDRRHRVEVFAEAYGVKVDGLVDAVIARRWKYARHVRYLHDRGLNVPWANTESVRTSEELARWAEANRALFE